MHPALHFFIPAPAQLNVAGEELTIMPTGYTLNSWWPNLRPQLMPTTLTSSHTTFLLSVHSPSPGWHFNPIPLSNTSFLTYSHSWWPGFWLCWGNADSEKRTSTACHYPIYPLHLCPSTLLSLLWSVFWGTGSIYFLLHKLISPVIVPFLLCAINFSYILDYYHKHKHSVISYMLKNPLFILYQLPL